MDTQDKILLQALEVYFGKIDDGDKILDNIATVICCDKYIGETAVGAHGDIVRALAKIRAQKSIVR